MLQKQTADLNFSQGLDTKSDPKQVSFGKFSSLQNSVFTKGALLQKRNGYLQLASLHDSSSSYATTFNGNLTAVGDSISAYNQSSSTWVSKGTIAPMEMSTLPLVRNSVNHTQSDSAISSSGLICTVYTEANGGTTTHKYVVADSVTGQNIIAPTAIPVTSGVVTGSARVFVLGRYFVIVFTNVITATSNLQYVAISITNPSVVTTNTTIASGYDAATTVSWDGIVANNSLYIAYNTSSGGQAIKVVLLSSTLVLSSAVSFAMSIATIVSVTADYTNQSGPIIYVSFYDLPTTAGYVLAVDGSLNTVFTPKQIISSGTILSMTSAAQNAAVKVFYEVSNNYSYDSSIPSHYVGGISVSQAGSVGSPYVSVRSVGLGSKAFLVDGVIYFLASFQSPYQSTYFLINGSTSTQAAPIVVAKLAYENGAGYLTLGLPSVSVSDNLAQVSYLFKDLVQALTTNSDSIQTTTGGIYSQTGINLCKFTIGTTNINSAEVGNNLNLTGGITWAYDGYLPVEQEFFLWPDSVEATWSASGGSIHAQPDGSTNTNAYYYQAIYEWSDNQGNIFRSAPSIPVGVTTTSNGTSGSITVNVPMLRLTYKTANPVKIVIYRWSVANQTYHQVTSITSAQLNDTTADSLAFVDTLADASIIGNSIIYTTGGVLENIGPPSLKSAFIFDDRLFGITSEDQNLVVFSKQVIEGTPVEMSDLLSIFVAPNIGAQGPSGVLNCGFPMDDKAVLFKSSSILYINGTGPDNTGANSQYSQPIFVTSTVGCSNQHSIVFTPQGLMFEFQSESGNQIWLLGRDLQTQYIGAGVEAFTTNATVQSAVNIPGTNQVRFTMSSGITLVYDYYYGQWGTFTNVPAVSSTLYQGLHTYIDQFGQAFQENPGSYLDGSRPVLMSFTTSWLNLAGLQGYQRAYFFYLLGQYYSPFKLNCFVAYDYNPAPQQATLVSPNNFAPTYGGAEENGQVSVYGQGTPYGGPGDILNQRVFLSKERCTAFQISIQEVYDASFGVMAGQGLSLSGLQLVFAIKKGFRPISSANSAGRS